MPGVYSVECMAQAADILLLSKACYAGKTPLFLGINNVRFRRKILPEDTIEIRAELASEIAEKGIATCSAKYTTAENWPPRGCELWPCGEMTKNILHFSA